MLSWINTLHSQHELSVSTVTPEDQAFVRVARRLKPFAKEHTSRREAKRLCRTARGCTPRGCDRTTAARSATTANM